MTKTDIRCQRLMVLMALLVFSHLGHFAPKLGEGSINRRRGEPVTPGRHESRQQNKRHQTTFN